MCSVVIRDGTVVELDMEIIREAIMKAIDVVSEIEKTISEAVKNISEALGTLAHTLGHLVLHARSDAYRELEVLVNAVARIVLFTLNVAASRIKGSVRFDPFLSKRLSAAIRNRVKHLTAVFQEHDRVLRESCIKRSQDRGSDENSDSDYPDYCYCSIPVKSL